MYQFYYAEHKADKKAVYTRKMSDEISIDAIRPTMWEEHCLECSAPLCYKNCTYYQARSDGRCKRFEDGYVVSRNSNGCSGQSVRVRFRRWANMMTILFPAMLSIEDYKRMTDRNQILGGRIRKIVRSNLPVKIRWESIRTIEYIRRRSLRKLTGIDNTPDAFIFQGYSFSEQPYNLILEIYEDSKVTYKTSLLIKPGENLYIVSNGQLNSACSKSNSIIKVYPENNLEVELDILWCDFVRGKLLYNDKPADKVKCVVWDLDNTIWNGTLIECENPENLELRDHVKDTIQALDERGIILSIASKNEWKQAWPVVEKLGIAEYFLYPQIHWNAKSSSMRTIASSLNIGLDSLVLIDDSSFERNQVMSELSQIRTYREDEIPSILGYPEFQVIISDESRHRREMYRAEEKRNAIIAADNSDTISFLRKCNLCISLFVPKSEEQIARCYELVVRTNQLNMSGRKYTRDEFREVLQKSNMKNIGFSCKDDYGSYGIVGYGQYYVDDTDLIFSEFAMSCRVAGKYVESALFAGLLNTEHCTRGIFRVNKTKKNILLRNTLTEIGFECMEENEKAIAYEFGDGLLHKELVTLIEE